MCFHNSLSKKAIEVKQRYKVEFEQMELFEPIYHASAFTYLKWPVITAKEPGHLQLFNWGLIPHWVKTKEEAFKFRLNTLNAKCETVYEKPSFKFSINQKRCLIPSTGFFEWRDENKKKYPYFITVKNQEIFSMAGIYQTWVDKETGEVFNTFSILTTAANPLLEYIHNSKKRMPVILPPEIEKEWIAPELTQEQSKLFFEPYPEDEMEAHTISKLITSRTEDSNVPEVSVPFKYEEV